MRNKNSKQEISNCPNVLKLHLINNTNTNVHHTIGWSNLNIIKGYMQLFNIFPRDHIFEGSI